MTTYPRGARVSHDGKTYEALCWVRQIAPDKQPSDDPTWKLVEASEWANAT